MSEKIILASGRGTKLYRNDASELTIKIEFPDSNGDDAASFTDESLMYISDTTLFYEKIDDVFDDPSKMILKIAPNAPYMVVNTTGFRISLDFSEEILSHKTVYDPYLYEEEDHERVDPEQFEQQHKIPEGYVDILAKWYSIKFTYSDENLIFIRPGLGISYQTHTMRQENWKVETGHPIIISGSRVIYDTKPGDEFQHPVGGIHTIINPTEEWISITETYKGDFDEEDIVRVFNPNNYGV